VLIATAVTAARNEDTAICEAFVSGLRSGYICQQIHLLEDNVRELQVVFDEACNLDNAQRNCEEFGLSADSSRLCCRLQS